MISWRFLTTFWTWPRLVGTVSIAMADLSMAQLCNAMLSEFEPVAKQKSLLYSIELADNTPLTIVTDPQRLRQVLKNLLANALQIHRDGRGAPGDRAGR